MEEIEKLKYLKVHKMVLPDVLEKITKRHILCDDEDGFLKAAHTKQV